MAICPECGHNTLMQSMREDFCTNCDYSERYEDAYAEVDPRGDFEWSEDMK